MIRGTVTPDREIVVPIAIFGSDGASRTVDAVIDTGFTGLLTLPEDLILELGLSYSGRTSAKLADASRVVLRRYDATIDWFGTQRDVAVLAADGGPLAGMALLDDTRLTADVIEGGSVTIVGLSQT